MDRDHAPSGASLAGKDRGLLRFMTCGSVDDGKSTLIGRLLHDCGTVPDDQLAKLKGDSERLGTQGADLDLALLVDGLAAEREQGITIDVAYRYFSSLRRSFIVADTPGHEQYTRNMVTGASTADAALILIDARKGVLTQTRRHAYLVSLLGIRRVVLAINKMDLMGWDEQVFASIVADWDAFAAGIGLADAAAIPISALRGDNVVNRGAAADWYEGPTLIDWLETVCVRSEGLERGLRLPVQWVNRPNPDFRGFAGRIAAGGVSAGDPVRVLPSGRTGAVGRVIVGVEDLDQAFEGQSVTLTLSEEIDISRGDVIVAAQDPCEAADQFETTIVWMDDEPLLPGRPYLLKLGAATATAQVTQIKHKTNVNTLEKLAATRLELNDIATCNLSLDRPIAFEPYGISRTLGGFILIDKLTSRTVGAGMINFHLRRADNIQWQTIEVDKASRAALKNQKGRVVWLTGLSGAGKSTIANLVDKRLHGLGRHTYVLDGDNIRHGLSRDLGFREEDRVENIRRVAEVAHLMVDAGLIVITAFISPFRAERGMARALMQPGEFIEVFVDTPLEEAERRDAKGLYRKARRGELVNFTGIDSPYEPPEQAELVIDTTRLSAEQAAEAIVRLVLDESADPK